jgi:cytochrome c556
VPDHQGENDMNRTSVLAMAAVAAGVTLVAAQSDPIAERKALMKNNAQNVGNLNRMVQGQDAFDAAKVAAAFDAWSANSQKIPTLFPAPPPAGAETRALPKIWEDKSGFEARAAALGKAAADNKGKAGTLDELKTALPNVQAACAGCHDNYRRPAPAGDKKK